MSFSYCRCSRVSVIGLWLTCCANDPSPWNAQSQRIELTCGSYFEGSMMFRANRDELSENQLSLLPALTRLDGNNGCPEDTRNCSVSITDSAGRVAKYYAEETNSSCGNPTPMIDYTMLAQLLETINCKYARLTPKTLVPDPRCLNGMFSLPSSTQPVTIPGSTATYQFKLAYCDQPGRASNVSMSLFLSDPATPVVTSNPVTDPGPDHDCAEMTLTNASTTGGNLVVTTSGGFTPAGDFFLQYY